MMYNPIEPALESGYTDLTVVQKRILGAKINKYANQE